MKRRLTRSAARARTGVRRRKQDQRRAGTRRFGGGRRWGAERREPARRTPRSSAHRLPTNPAAQRVLQRRGGSDRRRPRWAPRRRHRPVLVRRSRLSSPVTSSIRRSILREGILTFSLRSPTTYTATGLPTSSTSGSPAPTPLGTRTREVSTAPGRATPCSTASTTNHRRSSISPATISPNSSAHTAVNWAGWPRAGATPASPWHPPFNRCPLRARFRRVHPWARGGRCRRRRQVRHPRGNRLLATTGKIPRGRPPAGPTTPRLWDTAE